MTNAKLIVAPLPISHPLYEERMTPTDYEMTSMQGIFYRKDLGFLLFVATRTRLDVSTDVFFLEKYQQSPLVKHWKSMKAVVRYLIGTMDHGDLFSSGQEATFEA